MQGREGRIWRRALILDSETKKSFITYENISDRIIKVKNQHKTTIIQICAPTNKMSADQEVEEFYDKLHLVLDALKTKSLLLSWAI